MSTRNGVMRFLPLLLITLFALSVLLSACKGNSNGVLPPAAHSLSGSVSGDIRQNVAISVSGAMSASASTDANGNYSVSGLPNGSYTVTPSKAGYTFSQASRSVVISGADSSGNDFASAAVPYAITGTVGGAVTAGVTVTVAGTTEAGNAFTTSMTTTSGSYSVPNVPNGSYTVTPARPGYAFSPVSSAVSINAGSASIPAFASTIDSSVKFDLTGAVGGAIKSGVTISVTGAANGSASTLADGTYAVSGLPNGAYIVSASKPGYTFTTGISAAIDGADSIGNNFTATAVLYTLSGTVSGDLRSGVTVTLAAVGGMTEGGVAFGPIEATTSGDGSYSVPGVPNGVYTVTPAQAGYLFNPASRTVTISSGKSQNNDFIALLSPIKAFRASGGTGADGTGGGGGQFYAESYGSVKVLKSGTVDASFAAPPITAVFGDHHVTVSADTTVTSTDDTAGALCQAWGGDGSLFIGDGTGNCGEGNDTPVTGLTIDAGATLLLVEQGSGAGTLRLANDLVINGTLTTDLSSAWGLTIEANLIEVGSTGQITASAPNPGSDGGQIYLGQEDGITTTIINRGTIEAKGNGSGSGGYVLFEPSDLVVNYGTIDVSGGSAGGTGGEFDAYVDYGNFYSSGTVRMNGGDGDSGGYTGSWGDGWSCWIETVYKGNANGRNGDIIISGIWEARGGDGANGSGGSGGYMSFQTDGIGAMTLNAYMSVKGGTGAGSWAGSAGEIYFASTLDPNGFGSYSDPAPGRISISGTYDLRGGDSDQGGGNGGNLLIWAQDYYNGVVGVNSSEIGSDVECVGFPELVMNGGDGGAQGGSASASAFQIYTYSYSGSVPAGPITNQADIQAKGGNANAALSGSTGGSGGYVYLQTGTPGDTATVLTNSGNIDTSGGGGDAGGSAYDIYLQAQHVDNSGNLTADGGTGATGTGGNGGNVTLTSDDSGTPSTNTGTLSVTGGSGTPAGTDGTTNVL